MDGVYKLGKRLSQRGAWNGDVEPLETCATCPENGTAIQP